MSKRVHGRRPGKPRFHRRTRPGAAPGTVKVHPDAPRPTIRLVAYGPGGVVEKEIGSVDQLSELLGEHRVIWVNVDGLGDADTIRQLGTLFDLHSLALEDVVNVHQRAKVEPYETNVFIVASMVEATDHLTTEQVSMFLGKNYVLTFQQRTGDCFGPVRERIRNSSGRTRKMGADYLAYVLLDAVIDSYFPVTDRYADELDDLETRVTECQDAKVVSDIHHLRSDLLLLRRSIRPHREAINELVRDSSPFISDETQVYLRDCYDHCVQLIDLLEIYREVCSDLRDYYLSTVSNRMNEIMKVLTIIATIFIPLGFVAGVFGMNFDATSPWNMPELRWRYGYPFALGLMAAVAAGMVAYFKRKRWIGSSRQSTDRRPETG